MSFSFVNRTQETTPDPGVDCARALLRQRDTHADRRILWHREWLSVHEDRPRCRRWTSGAVRAGRLLSFVPRFAFHPPIRRIRCRCAICSYSRTSWHSCLGKTLKLVTRSSSKFSARSLRSLRTSTCDISSPPAIFFPQEKKTREDRGARRQIRKRRVQETASIRRIRRQEEKRLYHRDGVATEVEAEGEEEEEELVPGVEGVEVIVWWWWSVAASRPLLVLPSRRLRSTAKWCRSTALAVVVSVAVLVVVVVLRQARLLHV